MLWLARHGGAVFCSDLFVDVESVVESGATEIQVQLVCW
jgi:hypothetical protein